MLQIERVLKPDGLCCIISPSGGFEHRYPVDCWRFYPDEFRALARYAHLLFLEGYTQWKSESYDDGSDVWLDSVLIASKPSASCIARAKIALRRYVLLVGSQIR
jgi:hypothetical protein